MRDSTLKVISFNVLGIGAVVVGLFLNKIQPIFTNDQSYLTYVIGATILSVVVLSIYDCFRQTDWIRGFIKFEEANLRILGLIGTLVGLLFLINILGDTSGDTANGADFVTKMLQGFTQGLRTAFNPTLVGVTGWFWSRHLVYFTRND